MEELAEIDEKKYKNYSLLQEALQIKSSLDETCVLNQSLTLIADKWTLLILMALMQGTKRNSELLRQIAGISPKMLTQTLKTLIRYGMIKRKVYPEVPPRVEYYLTEFGKSTADPLAALLEWSVTWEDQLGKLFKQRNQKKRDL